jgi:hypothetical protein
MVCYRVGIWTSFIMDSIMISIIIHLSSSFILYIHLYTFSIDRNIIISFFFSSCHNIIIAYLILFFLTPPSIYRINNLLVFIWVDRYTCVFLILLLFVFAFHIQFVTFLILFFQFIFIFFLLCILLSLLRFVLFLKKIPMSFPLMNSEDLYYSL